MCKYSVLDNLSSNSPYVEVIFDDRWSLNGRRGFDPSSSPFQLHHCTVGRVWLGFKRHSSHDRILSPTHTICDFIYNEHVWLPIATCTESLFSKGDEYIAV